MLLDATEGIKFRALTVCVAIVLHPSREVTVRETVCTPFELNVCEGEDKVEVGVASPQSQENELGPNDPVLLFVVAIVFVHGEVVLVNAAVGFGYTVTIVIELSFTLHELGL